MIAYSCSSIDIFILQINSQWHSKLYTSLSHAFAAFRLIFSVFTNKQIELNSKVLK